MKFEYEQALSRQDALRSLCDAWPVGERHTEVVLLSQALDRITAENVYASCSIPVVRSSKRDGIAVKSKLFETGLPDGTQWQKGIDYAQADTGDDFPDEFDAVVAVEDIERLPNGGIAFTDQQLVVKPGDGVNQCGTTVMKDALLVPAYTKLSAEAVTACAIGGLSQVKVLQKPRVAFIPTGSELIPWGSVPERGKTIEANSLLVSGILQSYGAQTILYSIVKDEPVLLEKALDQALEAADIVLINGGSSRGEEDYNSKLLQKRASYFQHGVRAVPGRPIGSSIVEGKPVVNIPGPPLAAFLALDWLIRGLVAYYYNTQAEERQRIVARAGVDIKKPKTFERLVRVQLSPHKEGLLCVPVSSEMSLPELLTNTDAMLSLPLGSEGIHKGDMVEVELLRPLEAIRNSWKK